MDYLALVFDAVLVLVFVSAVLEGRRRGFAVTALSFIASVISIIAAKEYSEPLAQWANNSFVYESIVNKLTDISSNLGSGTETVIGALPSYIVNAAREMGVSVESLIGQLASDASVANVAEEITAAAEKSVILPLLNMVAFLVIFAVGKALLGIGARVIGLAAKLPVIRHIDKAIGAVGGALKGLIAVVIVSVVLYTVAGVAGDTEFGKAVNDTFMVQRIAQTVLLILFK